MPVPSRQLQTIPAIPCISSCCCCTSA
jgi:hypothetical protein